MRSFETLTRKYYKKRLWKVTMERSRYDGRIVKHYEKRIQVGAPWVYVLGVT